MLDFFVQDPASRSVSVTTISVPNRQDGPDRVDVDALRAVARDRFGVAIAGGLGPLAGKTFRIGRLGDSNPATILGCLGGLEAALQVQGIAIGRSGLRRAVDWLAAGDGT